VKNHRWLNVAEYLMLAGSGVGTVATAASQQALFAVAPLSALFVLNLLNHRRIEQAAQETTEIAVSQLDQKVATTLTTLQQQVQALPSPLHLATLRKDLQTKNQESYHELLQQIQQLQHEFAQSDWRSLTQDLAQVREQYAALAGSVAGVRESLSRLSAFNKLDSVAGEVEHLKTELAQLQTHLQTFGGNPKLNHYRDIQDQINHINRRLNKLPAPFDASVLRQEMSALVKAIADMASRRDVARVEAQLEKLAQQTEDVEGAVLPLKVVTSILKKQVDTVNSRLNGLEESLEPVQGFVNRISPAAVETLKMTVDNLADRVDRLPQTTDLTHLRTEVKTLVSDHLGAIQLQLDTVQQQTQDLDQKHRSLRDWVHRLPQLMDTSALHGEVKYLANRVEWAESRLSDLQTKVDQPAAYEWVFDVRGTQPDLEQHRDRNAVATFTERPIADYPEQGRSLLEQALQQAEARVVVVYPFPHPDVLDEAMIRSFQTFLEQRGCLDLGWGHLGISVDRQPRSIEHRRTIHPSSNEFLFNRLNQLTELKKQYPDQLRFKVLGTEEYFLVCDRRYAILGTQSIATSSALFPAATVGLRTTDPDLIQTFIERFDNPLLDEQDAASFFHRAAARYDLGNRQGALADYTAVLAITPDDDVAYNNRGLVRYDLEDKVGAIADFEAAIRHNPHNYVAYTNRGYVQSELGDKLAAIADYTTAVQLNPDYAIAYFYRGLAQTRIQNKLGAIQDYTEVVRLKPQDASVFFYRGLAYAKMGQSMEAMRDLRQAAQLFADQGDAGNYQQSLSALKKLQKLMVVGSSGHPLVSNGA
jgi:Flp pilus assembly protein TadD/archaellum component FlaC